MPPGQTAVVSRWSDMVACVERTDQVHGPVGLTSPSSTCSEPAYDRTGDAYE